MAIGRGSLRRRRTGNIVAVTVQDDPRELRRADFPVLRRLPTRWSDDDTYGHVNNVIHYLMFDTAVNGWLIEASGVYRLALFGEHVDGPAALGRFVHVYVNRDDRRPTPVPDEIRAALTRLR
jgi:acyl-CoA thioester hydrolase